MFLTDLYSHLLNLLCTSIFCCSIVKFQSLTAFARAATRLRESLSIIPQPFRFVKRFFKTFLSFFQALFVAVAFLAATRLLYHNSFRLSIGFWKFLKKFFKLFSNPSTHSSCCISCRFRDSLNILPLFPLFVNTFSQSFLSLDIFSISTSHSVVFCSKLPFSFLNSFVFNEFLRFLSLNTTFQCLFSKNRNGILTDADDTIQPIKITFLYRRDSEPLHKSAGGFGVGFLVSPKPTKQKRHPDGCLFCLVGHQGLEPRTDRLWAGSSNQLS